MQLVANSCRVDHRFVAHQNKSIDRLLPFNYYNHKTRYQYLCYVVELKPSPLITIKIGSDE